MFHKCGVVPDPFATGSKHLRLFIPSSEFFLLHGLLMCCASISCCNSQRSGIRPEIAVIHHTHPSEVRRDDILAEVAGVDTILCGLIDTRTDTTILEKAEYMLLSEESRRNIEACIEHRGLAISSRGNKVRLFNPAVAPGPDRARRVSYISFSACCSIANKNFPDDAQYLLRISIDKVIGPVESTARGSYTLKLLNGRFYIGRCNGFISEL